MPDANNASSGKEPLLHASGISKVFEGILALSDYSLTMRKGEMAGLIGPNGAGKTTVFNILSGVLAPSEGSLMINGVNMAGADAAKIARAGVSRTFQNIRLFNDLTVFENILVGFHTNFGAGFFSTLLHLPSYTKAERTMREKARYLAEMLRLTHLLEQRAGSLSYGDQRRLEIARALATKPELLLLDEPAAGMNPQETKELAEIIHRIHQEFALTVFLVEHDMPFVMDLCERIQVLNYGRLLTEGSPQEVRANPEVVAAYLGSSANKEWKQKTNRHAGGHPQETGTGAGAAQKHDSRTTAGETC